MLKTGKLTKSKRCVCDFRHINTRIAKTSLVFPLVRDMLPVIEGSKCKVLSVINLIDAYHSLKHRGDLKKYPSCVSENANGANFISSHMEIIHHCYYRLSTEPNDCEVIIDDLLLFTTDKKSHKTKVEGLLKALTKECIENLS